MKVYVGIKKSGKREVFKNNSTPTELNHGYLYFAVIGPFKTMRGANYMSKYGCNNPHLQDVADAERISKERR